MTLFLADTLGSRNNTSYKNEVVIDSAEAMKSAMQKDMIMGKRQQNSRQANKAWEWSECLFADVDGGMPIGVFQTRFSPYEYYLATSKSHGKSKGDKPPEDRYHVFFPIDRMDDGFEYQALLSALADQDGFDHGVKDPQRFFFGNPESIVMYNSGVTSITNLLYQLADFSYTPPVVSTEVSHSPMGEMGDGDGRNPKLYSIGSALLAKHRTVPQIVDEMRKENNRFKTPLSDLERDSVINSVFAHALPKEAQKIIKADEIKQESDWFASFLSSGHSEREFFKLDVPQPVQYVDDIITAGSNLLFAPPKWGKSWLAIQIGRAVSTGSDLFGKKTTRAPVVYLAAEDSEAGISSRVKLQAGWRTDSFHIYTNFSHIIADIDPLEVAERVIKHHGAKLLIIDTFSAFFGSDPDGGSAYQSDSRQIVPIHNLSKKLDVGLLVIHHTRKNRTGGFNDVNGSNAFLGGFDNLISCTQDRINMSGRLIKESYLNITFDTDMRLWKIDNNPTWDVDRSACRQIIEDELRSGPKSISQILKAVEKAESVSVSDAYVKKLVNGLVKDKYIRPVDASRGAHVKYRIIVDGERNDYEDCRNEDAETEEA